MKIEIEKGELMKLYSLFAELNDFFHQESNFTTPKIKEFASEHYPSISEFYYDKLWSLIPKEDQESILN
jgi:uncharacterized protein YqfB (UPF0267 family)